MVKSVFYKKRIKEHVKYRKQSAMKIITLLLATLLVSACSSGSVNFAKLETVSNVNLSKYSGDWYEIARIDHWFQEGCFNSKATYNIRDDGDIDVINTCDVGLGGKTKEAKGRAWVVDSATNAKLKVQFPLRGIKLPFLSGNYWIIELEEDYRHVMVGDEKREYLWILSREKTLPNETVTALVENAKTMGFPVDQLVYQEIQE